MARLHRRSLPAVPGGDYDGAMINGNRLPTITASRVALRWLRDDDTQALYRIFSDPETMRYWSSGPMTDESEAAELLAQIRTCFEERSLFQWGVVHAADDEVIGTCTLAQLDVQNRRAEVGFILNRDHWRRGYMDEALGALIGYAFDELQLNRLEADVDPRNVSSLALLQKMGFTHEGLFRERWIVDGAVQDSVMLGLLSRDRPGRPG